MKREWIKREKTVKNVCSIDTHTHTHVYARRFFLSWMFNSAIALDSLYLIRIILVQLIYLFILFILYFGCVHFFEHHIQAFANYISFFGERTVQLFFFSTSSLVLCLKMHSDSGIKFKWWSSHSFYSQQKTILKPALLAEHSEPTTEKPNERRRKKKKLEMSQLLSYLLNFQQFHVCWIQITQSQQLRAGIPNSNKSRILLSVQWLS